MKRDLQNIDEVVKRYWPPASNEDMQSDIDRAQKRLESGTARAIHPALAPPVRWRMALVAAPCILLLSIVGIVGWQYSRPAFAVVESEEGSLYWVVDGKSAAVHAHERLQAGETLRTNDTVGAQLKLADGSRIEMRSSSELLLEDTEGGVRIRLSTGGVIVNAAKQHGHLYVHTKDVTVSVVGTVFLVNAEKEGSRVGVIEGEVRVQRGAADNKLSPGQQIKTNPLMKPVSLQEAVAWSRHAESHVALLEQSAGAPASAPQRLEFEEVSIRPSPPPSPVPGGTRDEGGSGFAPTCPVPSLFQMQIDPGHFMVSNATPYALVALAYGKYCGAAETMGTITRVPGWMRSERFDIRATIPAGAFSSTPSVSNPKLQAMLQAMLKIRFQLGLHSETKMMEAYDLLLVDKGKLKLSVNRTPVQPAPGSRVCNIPGQPSWAMQSAPMSSMVNMLSAWFKSPVIDKTGVEELIDVCLPLEANYDIGPGRPPGPPILLPALRTAMQEQMGLKLQSSSVAPVEILVIDSVARPSEN